MASSESREQRKAQRRKLQYAAAFCLVFMFVEVIGGVLAGSIAVMTDAAHMLAGAHHWLHKGGSLAHHVAAALCASPFLRSAARSTAAASAILVCIPLTDRRRRIVW